jgi:hypothetical protein
MATTVPTKAEPSANEICCGRDQVRATISPWKNPIPPPTTADVINSDVILQARRAMRVIVIGVDGPKSDFLSIA